MFNFTIGLVGVEIFCKFTTIIDAEVKQRVVVLEWAGTNCSLGQKTPSTDQNVTTFIKNHHIHTYTHSLTQHCISRPIFPSPFSLFLSLPFVLMVGVITIMSRLVTGKYYDHRKYNHYSCLSLHEQIFNAWYNFEEFLNISFLTEVIL